MRHHSKARTLLLLFGAAPFFATPAHAGLTVCNKSTQPASVAYAFVNHGSATSILASIWGWGDVGPGECKLLNTSGDAMKNTEHWYVYARNAGGRWAAEEGHGLQDDRGYAWQTRMNLCAPQPPNNVAIWDNLQTACERLAYSIVDLQSGRVDYELDLNP